MAKKNPARNTGLIEYNYLLISLYTYKFVKLKYIASLYFFLSLVQYLLKSFNSIILFTGIHLFFPLSKIYIDKILTHFLNFRIILL